METIQVTGITGETINCTLRRDFSRDWDELIVEFDVFNAECLPLTINVISLMNELKRKSRMYYVEHNMYFRNLIDDNLIAVGIAQNSTIQVRNFDIKHRNRKHPYTMFLLYIAADLEEFRQNRNAGNWGEY